MSNESLRWHDNRAEVESIGLYRRNRLNHAADLWTVGDCWHDLRGINANRWSEEARELLYAAREAVAALHRAMLAEVDR